MARTYANYSLPSLNSETYKGSGRWMSARLVELAWICQGVVAVEAGGPSWEFVRESAEKTTKPELTLTFDDGATAYWSACHQRWNGEFPDWAKVQRVHAERLGATAWLLTDEFIADNEIEFANRTDAYYLLSHARGWDSSELERDLLMEVHHTPKSVGALAERLRRPVHQVKAAALRLWLRRLVKLTMTTVRIGNDWLIAGERHGLS